MAYAVRRSKISLYIGYFLAEGTLLAILAGMAVVWCDDPTYLDWPMAITSLVVVALFFHFLLFVGTFYRVQVEGESIEYHAFLRRTKRLTFSDIKRVVPSVGVDMKIVGHNRKTLFYVKLTDRNLERFMADVDKFVKGG